MKRKILLLALALFPLAGFARSPRPVGLTVARTYPYSLVGQFTFYSGGDAYIGSGTVVQPFGVLTAGHVVYDPVGGWSTDMVFKRSLYDDTELSSRTGSHIYVLSGYQAAADAYGGDDLRAFARDTGAVSFTSRPATGGYLGWTTNLSIVMQDYPKAAFGYGAVEHTGDELLVVAATPFYSVHGAFFESDNTAIEAGMSGGPVIATMPDGSRAVCGVVVAGSDDPVTGGIRIIDATTSYLILTYLIPPTQ